MESGGPLRSDPYDGNGTEVFSIPVEDPPDRQDPVAKHSVPEKIARNLQAAKDALILQHALWFQKIEIRFAAPDHLEPLLLQ